MGFVPCSGFAAEIQKEQQSWGSAPLGSASCEGIIFHVVCLFCWCKNKSIFVHFTACLLFDVFSKPV